MRVLKPKIVKAQRELCEEAVEFKNRLAAAGLWKTFHKMDEVANAIGWEVAEQWKEVGVTP